MFFFFSSFFFFLFASLLIACIAIYKAIPHLTLWFDEATYFVNVRDISWYEILKPLPFYNIVAPFGYTAVLKLVYQLVGLNEYALRAPSLVAYAGVFMVAMGFPSLTRLERAAFSVILCSSFVLLDYSFQAKHYLLELFFIVLLIAL